MILFRSALIFKWLTAVFYSFLKWFMKGFTEELISSFQELLSCVLAEGGKIWNVCNIYETSSS